MSNLITKNNFAIEDEKPRVDYKRGFILSMLSAMPAMLPAPTPAKREPGSYNPHSITRAQFKHKKKRTKAQKLSRRKNR